MSYCPSGEIGGLSTENKKIKTICESSENSKNTTNAIFINDITICSHFIKPASVISVPFVELLQKTIHDKTDANKLTIMFFPAGNWPL
jgi:hypothetical protein